LPCPSTRTATHYPFSAGLRIDGAVVEDGYVYVFGTTTFMVIALTDLA